RGWSEFEWRWQCVKEKPRAFNYPRWDGSALENQAILLWSEQGLGDILQFVRYALLVRKRVGTVLLEAPASLHPLLSRCPGIDRLLTPIDPLPAFAAQAPLLSLPGIFGTTLSTVPANVPYLSADPSRLKQWSTRFQHEPGFKVGIVWQGST